MKISVLMGVYKINNEEILSRAINSILNQTYSDFELIICDDGSKDETMQIVKKICNDDKRVVFLENDENKGLAYVLNKCFKYAKGKYIARMDADDESALNRFEMQVKFLDEHPEIDLVSCCCDIFDDNGIYGEKKYKSNIEKNDFLFNSPIIHAAMMVRKEALEKVNGYRDINKTYRVEDYDLFMRMFAEGQKMFVLPEKLYNIREDKNTYARRKYKYRINEFKVRYENFKKLGLLPQYYIYCLKPLIVGLIPISILKKIRNKIAK